LYDLLGIGFRVFKLNVEFLAGMLNDLLDVLGIHRFDPQAAVKEGWDDLLEGIEMPQIFFPKAKYDLAVQL